MEDPQTRLLITLTGRDRPGVTARLFATLARHELSVLDAEQVVIRGRLVLGVLLGCDGPPDLTAIHRAVTELAADLGLEAEITTSSAEPPGRAGSRARRLLGREVQIVFQDPYSSLDPRQRIGPGLDELIRVHEPDLAAALPRAGFWIRMAALAIDALIVSAICCSFLAPRSIYLTEHFTLQGIQWMLPLAAYGAFMWKLKGSTVGGIVCGLRVARLDGRPIEWETAIVRALACFLSAILWLGFIWIALDPEKQGWHDKIAGTAVVRVPKGSVSLV